MRCYGNADLPGRNGETVTVRHSYAPPGIVVRSVAVSFGGITCSPKAVVHPAGEAAPWVTPSRKETVSPGATASADTTVMPKKSCVVCVGSVGSGAPAPSRNRTPGYPIVAQVWPLVLRSANPSSPCPVAPCPPRNDSARSAARHRTDPPPLPLVVAELLVPVLDHLLADPLVADPLVVVGPFGVVADEVAVVADEVAVVAGSAAVELTDGVPDAGEDDDDLLADPPQEASANPAITIKAALKITSKAAFIQFVFSHAGVISLCGRASIPGRIVR